MEEGPRAGEVAGMGGEVSCLAARLKSMFFSKNLILSLFAAYGAF
jgi:hypothetical protein